MPCFEILWLLLVSPNSVTAWLSSLCISDIAYWRQNGTKANFRISSSLYLKGVCIKSKCSIWGLLEGHVISKLIFCFFLDSCSKTRESIELLHISAKANVTILFKFAYIYVFFCGRLQRCFNRIYKNLYLYYFGLLIKTQEVDSTDSINQNVPIQIARRNIDTHNTIY